MRCDPTHLFMLLSDLGLFPSKLPIFVNFFLEIAAFPQVLYIFLMFSTLSVHSCKIINPALRRDLYTISIVADHGSKKTFAMPSMVLYAFATSHNLVLSLPSGSMQFPNVFMRFYVGT